MKKIINQPNQNNRQGFSLIEVSVSLSIVVIVLLGLIVVFPFSLKINGQSANLTKAVYLAQAGIEQILSLEYENIGAGAVEPKNRLSNDPASYLYDFQRQTEVSYLDANFNVVGSDSGLKKIKTTVFWQDRFSFQETNFSLETLISQK